MYVQAEISICPYVHAYGHVGVNTYECVDVHAFVCANLYLDADAFVHVDLNARGPRCVLLATTT